MLTSREENKEQEILRAAGRVFARKDYHRVTMQEVAEEAQVGKGTLYRYYKSKDDLYFSIIRIGLDALEGYLRHEASKASGDVDKLKRVIAGTLFFFEKNRPFVKVFLQEEVRLRDQGEHPCLAAQAKLVRLTEEMIEQGQEAGVFRRADVPLTAALLIGMLKGAFLSELDALVKLDLEDRARIISDLFLQGALAPAARKVKARGRSAR